MKADTRRISENRGLSPISHAGRMLCWAHQRKNPRSLTSEFFMNGSETGSGFFAVAATQAKTEKSKTHQYQRGGFRNPLEYDVHGAVNTLRV